MPDRTITMPVAGEAHQGVVAASSSGSATAGAVVLVIPNNMTAADVERGLRLLMDRTDRDPQQINGI
jgi:hypothetical protein